MSMLRKTIIGAAGVVLLFGAVGCAHMPDSRTAEERVADRALERRQALIDGDFEQAYAYLSPGYRENVSLRGYRGRFGGAVSWTDAEVRDVECGAEDACTATVLLHYRVSMPRMDAREGQRPIEEQWVRSDGEWWFLLRR